MKYAQFALSPCVCDALLRSSRMDGDPVRKVPSIFRQTSFPTPSELAVKRKARPDNEDAAKNLKADTGFWVWNHWECLLKETVVDASGKSKENSKYKCNTCKSILSGCNVTRLKDHLLNLRVCKFLDTKEARQQAITEPDVKEAMPRSSQGSTTAASAARAFTMDSISKSDKQHLDELFIEMLINAAWSFCVVENPAVLLFFCALRPAYQLPSRYEVGC